MSIALRGAASPQTQPIVRATLSAAIVFATIAMLGACTDADADQRARLLASPAVQRLVGTWDVSFTNDPHASIDVVASARPVKGTMAFTADHHGPASTEELRGITHEGSYDLDFSPFGWTTRSTDVPAVAVARVTTNRGGGSTPDSLYVVLSPGTERFAVRMAGSFADDSAWGVWSARAYSAGGGAGQFTMRRHAN